MADSLKPTGWSNGLLGSGLVLLFIGVVVGLVPHSDNTSAPCGSVLFGGSVPEDRVLACEWAVRGPTWWLWLLVVVGALAVLCGLITRRRPARASS